MAPFSKVPWNTLMEQITKVRALGINICWLDMAGVGVLLSKEVKVSWLTHTYLKNGGVCFTQVWRLNHFDVLSKSAGSILDFSQV